MTNIFFALSIREKDLGGYMYHFAGEERVVFDPLVSEVKKSFLATWIILRMIFEKLFALPTARRLHIRDKGLMMTNGAVYKHSSILLEPDERDLTCSALVRRGRSLARGKCLYCWRCEEVIKELPTSLSSIDEWLKSAGLTK